jgi:hypothetical protein
MLRFGGGGGQIWRLRVESDCRARAFLTLGKEVLASYMISNISLISDLSRKKRLGWSLVDRFIGL